MQGEPSFGAVPSMTPMPDAPNGTRSCREMCVSQKEKGEYTEECAKFLGMLNY
jgi:hypothetical protein